MSKKEKLLERFHSLPKNFLWKDLVKVFEHYGFEKKSVEGSIFYFINSNGHKHYQHRPHPGNEVKFYALKKAKKFIDSLEEENDEE